MVAYQLRWSPLDMVHWQTRIENSYKQVLQLYPEGCLNWLRELQPARVAQLKATVVEIRRAYAYRDSQGLDAALVCYRDSHLKAFADYLALPQTDAPIA